MLRKPNKRQNDSSPSRNRFVTDLAVIKPDDANCLAFAFSEPHGPDTSIQTARAELTEADIRAKLASIGPIAPVVTLRTVPPVHEAITKVYEQEGIGSQSDEQILDTLIRAAEGDRGTFFGGNLEQVACDFTRLPNNQIAVTELPSEILDSLFSSLTAWTAPAMGSEDGPIPGTVVVETALRALLRYHLVTLNFDRTQTYQSHDDSATAILAINAAGFAIGLWSPCRGLIRELGEPFRVSDAESDAATNTPSPQTLENNAKHAIARLMGLIRDATNVYQFPNVDSVLLSASESMSAVVSEKALRYANAARKQLSETTVPLEQAVAWGLALGADSAGPLPVINLAEDLRRRLSAIQESREADFIAGNQQRRALAFFLLLLPFFVALGFVVGTYLNASLQSHRLNQVHEAELREEARLKTIQAERKAATENIRWFQTVVSQIIDRRSRQGGIIRLFDDLDARWPTDDPTFYVRELTVKQDGYIEMKGLTKREESVVAFGRSLEFSSGVFQNIAPTTNSTPVGVDALSPNGVPVTSQVPPGVTAWTLKGVYVPLKTANTVTATQPSPATQPSAPSGGTR